MKKIAITMLAFIFVSIIVLMVIGSIAKDYIKPDLTKKYIWNVEVVYLNSESEIIECEMDCGNNEVPKLILTENGTLKATTGIIRNKVIVNDVKKFKIENVRITSIEKKKDYGY